MILRNRSRQRIRSDRCLRVSRDAGRASRSRLPQLRTFFDPHAELTITRAPGRLDVMGGIADYSGSLVLELPIAEATLVALQKDEAPRVSIISLVDDESRALSFEMPLADLERDGAPIDYDAARAYFAA